MRIQVDTTQMDKLLTAMDEIGGREHTRRQAEAAKPVVERLYVAQFYRRESPEGKSWAAPAHDYGHPLMLDTRELQGGATVTPTDSGIHIRVSVPGDYDRYHQNGTPRMPDRKIVPATKLGPIWREEIDQARADVQPRLP